MAFTGTVTKFNKNKGLALISVEITGQPNVRTTTSALEAAGVTAKGQRVTFDVTQAGKHSPRRYVNFRLLT